MTTPNGEPLGVVTILGVSQVWEYMNYVSPFWGQMEPIPYEVIWNGEPRTVLFRLLGEDDERAIAVATEDYDEAERFIAEATLRAARMIVAVNGVPMPDTPEEALAEIQGQRGNPKWPAALISSLNTTYIVVCDLPRKVKQEVQADPFGDAEAAPIGAPSTASASGAANA